MNILAAQAPSRGQAHARGGGTIGDFEYVSIASGQRRERILEASEGRSPREHPEYADWIRNAGLIREKGLTILAGERTGIVMACSEGYREWVEAQVGRMEAYLREDAVRIEADAVRERRDAFWTAAVQWRNLITREADTDGRSRLGHDAYRDWHRYCLDLEAEGTAILDHARAAGLPDRDGALARIREAVGTAAAWRGEDEAQGRD